MRKSCTLFLLCHIYLFQDYVSTVLLAFVLLFMLFKYVYMLLQEGLCCLETTLEPNLAFSTSLGLYIICLKNSEIQVDMEMFCKLQSSLFLQNAFLLFFNFEYNHCIETQGKCFSEFTYSSTSQHSAKPTRVFQYFSVGSQHNFQYTSEL